MEANVPLYDPRHPEHNVMRKRVLRKIDMHVIPGLTFLWLAAFIDRSNVGNARVAGLGTDLKLKGLEFNTALAVFYLTYILSELPSNAILKRVGGRIWLNFLVLCWGIITVFSGWMSEFSHLIVVRLLLGLFEGGLLPGMVLYLSTIYKRHELQVRVGLFYSAASLSGAFGGLLAYVIEKMDGMGGRPGWAWIFILEGLATVVIAVGAYFYMPDGLATAKFLTEEERDFAINRFKLDIAVSSLTSGVTTRAESIDSNAEKFKEGIEGVETSNIPKTIVPQVVSMNQEEFEWGEVKRGFTDPQVWITGWAYMSICVGLYSYSLFLPTIIRGMGQSGADAQLRSAFPYLPASVLVIIIALVGDRYKIRGPLILGLLPIAIVGYVMILITNSNTIRYVAVFLMAAGIYASVPALLCILPNNVSGITKRGTATALQLMITNLSGFVASFIYTPDQAPAYKRGHSIALAFTCLAWVLIAIQCLYCKWENNARAAGRRDGNIAAYQQLVASGRTKAPFGDRDPLFRMTI
jgi:MFS family permease